MEWQEKRGLGHLLILLRSLCLHRKILIEHREVNSHKATQLLNGGASILTHCSSPQSLHSTTLDLVLKVMYLFFLFCVLLTCLFVFDCYICLANTFCLDHTNSIECYVSGSEQGDRHIEMNKTIFTFVILTA